MKPTGPRANMNLWSVTALGVGAMVGAGIFAVLGQVALVAGPETYAAFILGGLVAALSGYSYANLAVRYPDAGGVTAYFDEAFGKAQVSGTLSLVYMFTIAATIALVAKAFGAYAAPLLLGGSDALSVGLFASGVVVLLTLLNVAGSGLVGRAEILLVGVKLVILAALLVAGAASLVGKAPIAQLHPSLATVIGAVGLTFLAYAGYDNTANAASSVANPRRTIPLAIFLAISVVVVLYVGLGWVVVASVPPAQLAHDADTAVAQAARPVLGQAGYVVVSIGALLATASGINAWIYNGMNISLALARGGQLPRIFAHPAWRKGTRGVLLSVAGILLILNVFDLAALADIASGAFLIIYLAVHLANWRLARETGGNRWIVGAGLASMAAVLGFFLWSTALARPWSVALIGAFLAASWVFDGLLRRKDAVGAKAAAIP